MKNIVIVGFGFMGVMHAQAYQNIPQARIGAVVSRNAQATKKKLKALGLKAVIFASLRECLEEADIDMVDICLPTDEHEKNILLAVGLGKHVFCEKPIALTEKSATKIVGAAHKAGVKFMVGQCLRFWPEYQALKDLVAKEKAGRLLSLSLQRRSARPDARAGNWLLDENRSGGCVLDLHIHDTDLVHWLLGSPEAVTSLGTRDETGWSHVFTTYRFDDRVVIAEGGWNYPAQWGFQMAFQAVFEQGTVEYDSSCDPGLFLTLGNKAKIPWSINRPSLGDSQISGGNLSALAGYFLELKYFLTCLEDEVHPRIATGAQALQTLRTVRAEIRSLEQKGKTVRVS